MELKNLQWIQEEVIWVRIEEWSGVVSAEV